MNCPRLEDTHGDRIEALKAQEIRCKVEAAWFAALHGTHNVGADSLLERSFYGQYASGRW